MWTSSTEKEIKDAFMGSEIFGGINKEFKMFSSRVDGWGWIHRKANDLSLIISFSQEADDQVWKHASIARKKRMPTYNEIECYKTLCCGDNVYALIVFPPKDKWVGIHKYCVHLWEPMERYVLPEFSGMIGRVRSV